MNLSPALSAEYMDEKFNLESKLSTYELSQVLRQKSESLILKNATAIRDNLKEETYFKLDFEFGDDFKKISNFDIAGDFVQKFRENPDEAVIIAYTNASVRNYNKQVRELLFHNLSSIVPGDRIVVSKNNIKHGFLNGQMLYVENVDEERESKSIKFRGEPAVNLVFTNIEVSYTDPEGQKLLQEVKILNNFLESADGKIEKNILRALLVDFKKRFKAAGHTKSEFKEYLRNDEYYNALFIKHGYAITCHKAQGGEWDNVYFDFKQQSNRFSEMYSRYCYTGITRSKKQLYTINSPEKSIFSDKIKIKKGGQVPGILKMNAANICVLEDANNLAEGLEDYLTDLLQSLDVRFSLERKGYRFEISLQYGIADYRTDVIFNNEGQIKIHHYFSDTQMDDVKEELDKLDQSIFVLQNNENDDEFITAIKNEMIEKIGLLDVKVISVKHSEYKVAMLVVYKNKLLGFDIYYNSMKSVTSLFVNSSSESVKDEIIEVLK